MKALITGGGGKLAKQLLKVFDSSEGPLHHELDITDRTAVFDFVREKLPDVVLHAAALTGVRQCEEDKPLAWSTNVSGTENLVDACEKYSPSAYFVYISTACVFRGDRGGYVEDDSPYPKNYYALTKLVGETVARRSKLKTLVIRTNFVAREKWPYPKAFADRYGTYLFADDLARAIKEVVSGGMTGVVHLCGRERLSMLELARITTPDVMPTSMSEYSGPPLTVDMTLHSKRIEPFTISR